MSPKYQGGRCSRVIRSLKDVPKPAIQVVFGTFGTETGCLSRFTRRFARRPHLVQLHFSNETCRPYPGRCGDGEFFRRLSPRAYEQLLLAGDEIPTLQARLSRILAVADAIRGAKTRLALSLGLEHDFSDRAARRLLGQVRKGWPYAVVFNARDNHRPRGVARVRAELHTDRPACRPGEFVSADGFDLGPAAARAFVVRARAQRCGGVFLFRPPWSGRHGRAFVALRLREFRFSEEDVRYVRQAFR